MVEDFIAHLSVPWLREFYRPWFKEPPGDTADIYFKTFAMVPAWALRAACELALFTDLSHEVGTLALPALVVQGSHDPYYGPACQAREVLPFLPNAEVATIDCGHGLISEEPREIAFSMYILKGIIYFEYFVLTDSCLDGLRLYRSAPSV